MCELRLPRTLMPLYSDLPRIVEVDAGTVDEAIDELEQPLARLARPDVRAGPGAADRTSTSTSTRSAPRSTRRSTSARAVQVVAAISGG